MSGEDQKKIDEADSARHKLQRRQDHCTSIMVLPALALALVGFVAFDIIMETNIIARVPAAILSNTQSVCTPEVLNASTIQYHSGHRYYDELKSAVLPDPVFRQGHSKLCEKKSRFRTKYEYCLPISGRKDSPFCTAADRMDLLNLRSSKSICFASVLHMLMVEVYEELQATGNIPFLAFGSLLGAVRNGSMIPFTEDVDIGYVGEMIAADDLRFALRKKGYHMFFLNIWRVCVAPTHPLAGHLYDPNLPISTSFSVPYVDLYNMQQKDSGDWDLEELEGSSLAGQDGPALLSGDDQRHAVRHGGGSKVLLERGLWRRLHDAEAATLR
jgi:hypothetical protein